MINDWRKFKLESEDTDPSALSKKEILRQLSSPHRSSSKEDKDTRDRFSRKVRARGGKGQPEQISCSKNKKPIKEVSQKILTVICTSLNFNILHKVI